MQQPPQHAHTHMGKQSLVRNMSNAPETAEEIESKARNQKTLRMVFRFYMQREHNNSSTVSSGGILALARDFELMPVYGSCKKWTQMMEVHTQGQKEVTLKQFVTIIKGLALQRGESLDAAVARMNRSEGLRKLERKSGASATALLSSKGLGVSKMGSRSNRTSHRPAERASQENPGPANNVNKLTEDTEGVRAFWDKHRPAMHRIFVECLNRRRNVLQQVCRP